MARSGTSFETEDSSTNAEELRELSRNEAANRGSMNSTFANDAASLGLTSSPSPSPPPPPSAPGHHVRKSTQLPPGWNKHNDGQGTRYYSHQDTQQSQWEAPDGAIKPTSASASPTAAEDEEDAAAASSSSSSSSSPSKEAEATNPSSLFDDDSNGMAPLHGFRHVLHDSLKRVDPRLANPRLASTSLPSSEVEMPQDSQEDDDNSRSSLTRSRRSSSIHVDPATGKRYSFNGATGETKWLTEEEGGLDGMEEGVGKEGGGRSRRSSSIHVDPATGKRYSFNGATGKTKWLEEEEEEEDKGEYTSSSGEEDQILGWLG